MSVALVGANPGLTLFAGADRVAFASVWQVDWSEHGPGRALVVWLSGHVRVITPRPALGTWLEQAFVRHFPEVEGLAWPPADVTEAPVDIVLDHAVGLRASGADVEITVSEPLDRRVATADAFPLGDRTRGFSTVYMPCARGSLSVGGTPVDGSPRVEAGARPSSTAFLAVAEVWTTGSPAAG